MGSAIDDRWNVAFVVVAVVIVVGDVVVVIDVHVVDDPRKFGLNGVKSSWDIDDVELPVVVVVV